MTRTFKLTDLFEIVAATLPDGGVVLSKALSGKPARLLRRRFADAWHERWKAWSKRPSACSDGRPTGDDAPDHRPRRSSRHQS